MIRIQTFCDKTISVLPPETLVIAANTATEVIPSDTDISAGQTMLARNQEYAARWIQNVGAGTAQVCIGIDADGKNYHLLLPANQTLPLDISVFGTGKVSMWSTAGTTVSVIVARRVDLSQHVSIFASQQPGQANTNEQVG